MSDRPNLVFLLPDQLRHDFLGCYGATFLDTPNIDRLSAQGVRYTQCYSEHPLCVPARVALLTGMHGLRTGVLDNGQFLRPDYAAMGLQTWPELLNAQGYYTAAIGKMHFYPWDARMGFQFRSIAEDKRWIHIRDDYDRALREQGLQKYHGNECAGYFENKGAVFSPLPREAVVDHFVGEEACAFIERHGQEGPFAMMVGFPGPHCPYDPVTESIANIDPGQIPGAVPPTPAAEGLRLNNVEGNRGPWNGVDYSTFTPEQIRKVRTHYAGLVQQIDDEVGRILATLEQQGLLDNTIVIFSSDHGDYLGDHGMIGKGTFFESSIHVPLLVRMPGHNAPATEAGLVALTDVTATLLALAGVEIPAHMDSRALPGPGLPGQQSRDCLIGATQGGWWIDDGRWRLCKYAGGEQFLFDRQADPDEQASLYATREHQGIRDALDAALTRTVMAFTADGHFDHRVYMHDLSQDPGFGREGWRRPFPRHVDDPQARRQ